MTGDDHQLAGDESGDTAGIILLGAVILGLSALIGISIVNVSRDGGGEWLDELYQGRVQVRAYWLVLLYSATGAILMISSVVLMVLAGFILCIFLPVVRGQTSARVRLVYTLYLVGLAVGPAAVVGIIMAYLGRPADGHLPSHRQLQVQTFWVGVLYWAVGFLFLVTTFHLDPLSAVLGFVVPFVTPVGCLMLIMVSEVVLLPAVWTHPADMVPDPAGWLLMPLAALSGWVLFWWTKRCVRGLRFLSRQEPCPNPQTLLW